MSEQRGSCQLGAHIDARFEGVPPQAFAAQGQTASTILPAIPQQVRRLIYRWAMDQILTEMKRDIRQATRPVSSHEFLESTILFVGTPRHRRIN